MRQKSSLYRKTLVLVGFLVIFFFHISAAYAANYYFNNAQGDNDWADIGNWWTDSGFTVPAVSLPSTGDSVFITEDIDSISSGSASVHDADFSNGAVFDKNNNGLTLTVSTTATFHGTSYVQNGATIEGSAVFNDSSSNRGTVTGNATFNDLTYNSGTVSGTATYSFATGGVATIPDGGQWANGTASSNVGGDTNPITSWIFDGSSCNNGTVTSAATTTFKGSSCNGGDINGNAAFNGTSSNAASVTGNAVFFGDSTENTGTINGTRIRYYSSSLTTSRDFTSGGQWTVIADTAAVNVSGAIFDQNTVFETKNGGSFIGGPATLYFYSSGSDANWTTVGNWYTDSGHTSAAGIVPPSYDPVVTEGTVAPTVNLDTWTAPRSIDATATGITFTSSHNNQLSISVTGNAVFNGSSSNNATITGNATFNDTSFNNGTVTGTITVNTPYLIPAGSSPDHMIIVGNDIYVLGSTASKIYVIDSRTDSTVTIISLPFGFQSTYMLLVGKNIYISNDNSPGAVAVVDVDPTSVDYNTVISSIFVGADPLYLTNDGTNIYVDASGTNAISVIDANPSSSSYNTVIATIIVGSSTEDLYAIGDTIYVNDGSGKVYAISADPSNVAYNTVIAMINTEAGGSYFSAVSGTNLYANNVGDAVSDGKVYIIDANPLDPNYNTVTGTITVGVYPDTVIVVGGTLYVRNDDSHTISAIDLNPQSSHYNTVIATLSQTGNFSGSIGTNLYLANSNGTLSILNADPSSANYNTVVGTISVGSGALNSIFIDNKIYTTDSNSNSLSVTNALTNTSINVLAPHLLTLTSSSTDGVYATGQTVSINANFNKLLAAGSTMTVVLNTGASVTLNTVSGSTLRGTYTVRSGDVTPDLTVSSVTSASVSDTSGTPNTETHYTVPLSPELTGDSNGNVGDTSNISINGNYVNVTVGTNPYQLATVGTLDYVANQGSNSVSVVNTTTNTVTATISVGDQPYGVAYATSTMEVYVTNLMGNSVSVIDANPSDGGTYNTVTHTISVGDQPYYITSLGSNIYVTNHVSNTVSVINTTSHTVTHTIIVGVAPLSLKILGSKLYVANFGSTYDGTAQGTVSVINTATNQVIDTIIVGSGARGVAVYGSYIYVTNFNDGTISVIDTSDDEVIDTITVGDQPRGITTVGSNVYVENYADGTISVINTGTNTVTNTIKVGNTPAGMAAVGTDIYLSRFTDDVLSILDTTADALLMNTPTVTAQSVTGITTTGATLNGSMAASGSASSTIEGFNYGNDATYGLTASSTGTFGAGTFSQAITGLTCNSTYHYEVFATNPSGTSYSPDETFTTSTCALSGGGGGGGWNGAPAGGGGYVPTMPNIPNFPSIPNATTTPIPPGPFSGLNSSQISSIISLLRSFGTDQGVINNIEAWLTPSFGRDLSLGSVGADVKALQEFLNERGFTIATSGVGSSGNESTYFGYATQQALIRFQNMNNITPAQGYFGLKTRAYLNGL